MLLPRRVKHRKVMRGRMSGQAKGGHFVAFGDYGLATLEPAWITSRQIEAARHRLYKRVIRLTTKFKAHDEANDAHVGDTVLIEESRPLSATKRWRLVEVVQRAGDHGGADLVGEEAAVSEAIHAAAHPGRAKHEGEGAEGAETVEGGEGADA